MEMSWSTQLTLPCPGTISPLKLFLMEEQFVIPLNPDMYVQVCIVLSVLDRSVYIQADTGVPAQVFPSTVLSCV
jgi:hypothetical protein